MADHKTERFLTELRAIKEIARKQLGLPLQDEAKPEPEEVEAEPVEVEPGADPAGQKAADAREAMLDEGATEAEVQDAEHSGALLAGGSDEDGDPAPAPGSEAAEQGKARDTNDKAVPEDDRTSEADEQRAVIDLQAPADEKREAAENAAHSEDDDYETVDDLKERAKEAGITGYSHMKRAELLAALAK